MAHPMEEEYYLLFPSGEPSPAYLLLRYITRDINKPIEWMDSKYQNRENFNSKNSSMAHSDSSHRMLMRCFMMATIYCYYSFQRKPLYRHENGFRHNSFRHLSNISSAYSSSSFILDWIIVSNGSIQRIYFFWSEWFSYIGVSVVRTK